VLANILARPLELLAPLLAGHLEAGGDLLLSGILERQAEQLMRAYAPWCALEVADRDAGWVLLAARGA
jgi:ribosomal protein L11 methyltransferase